MNKCMYCGKVAPKMSLVCDKCAAATTELLPVAKERKDCWNICGCCCDD